MDSRVRLYASACFYYSGLVGIARWWARRSRPHLTIVYYHQAAQGNLRDHWLYLRRHYHIVPLEIALEALKAGSQRQMQGSDRRPLLAVTFDDGYYDNYTQAYSLARELQIPFTIFLIPGYIENGNAFWWATRLLRHALVDRVTFEEQSYNLREPEERKALALVIDARFSECASASEREQLLASLSMLLALPASFKLKESPAPLLSWEQVREMEESGWVSYGAHTMYHPDLRTLTDPADAQREVVPCRAVLEDRLGHSVRLFAYPFGGVGEHGPGAVKLAGYDWAMTTQSGVNDIHCDPHLLFRRNMDGGKHWLIAAAETAGIWSFFSRLKKGSVVAQA
ncbi:MAG TPA: polysaccharide deacetylase family protein [Ktedonobacteraceae bacterium]